MIRVHGAVRRAFYAALLLFGVRPLSADPPPGRPWDGAARRTWIDAAAGKAFNLDGTPNLTVLPEVCVGPCPHALHVTSAVGASAAAELHAIGIYESSAPTIAEDGKVTVSTVKVRIRPTARPVRLYVSSYDPVVWEIVEEPGAKLERVYYRAYRDAEVRVPSHVGKAVRIAEGPIASTWEATYDGEPGAKSGMGRVERAAEAPLVSFQGDYKGVSFVVPFYVDGSVLSELMERHNQLLRERTAPAPGPFYLARGREIVRRDGAREERVATTREEFKAVAPTGDEGRFFAITDHDLYEIDAAKNVERKIEPPKEVERFSWLGGVAWDGDRKRVVVTTRWHTGVHHLYEPGRERWTTVPIEYAGGPLHAVAYRNGVIYAFGIGGIVLFDPDLKPTGGIRVGEGPRATILGTEGPVQMTAFPDALVLWQDTRSELERMDFDEAEDDGGDPRQHERCHLIALPSGKVSIIEQHAGSGAAFVGGNGR